MLYIKSVDDSNPVGKAVQNYANAHFNYGLISGFIIGFSLGLVIGVSILKKN
jgi:hypothetical protein